MKNLKSKFLLLLLFVHLPFLSAKEISNNYFNYSLTTGVEGSFGSVLEIL